MSADFDNDPHNGDDWDIDRTLLADIRFVAGLAEVARVAAVATGFACNDAVRVYVEVRRELRSLVRLYGALTGEDLLAKK